MAKDVSTDTPAAPIGPRRTEPADTPAPRLSVQLTPDGRIAWDRIRPATREQLARALADPTAAQQLGAREPIVDPSTLPGAIQPDFCGVIYDALSTVAIGFAQRQGYTAAQAEVVRFTPEEKGALAAPTAAVLNKYVGPVGKYQDEAALLMLLATVVSGKVAALRATAAATGDTVSVPAVKAGVLAGPY